MPDYRIPNLANACRVLKHLADEPQPLSISRLASALRIPRTTCLRIVQTLASEGFLAGTERGFILGGGLIPLGTKALRELDLPALAAPILRGLSDVTGETSHVAVWNEGRALIIAVNDSVHPLRASSRPGMLTFAHCSATGKVLLAFNHLENLDAVIPPAARERRTARTIVDTPALERELRRVVATGYAVDNEEYHEGVRCLAAPVHDAHGRVCASIGVTASTTRFPTDAIARISVQIRSAAERLSSKLGWSASA